MRREQRNRCQENSSARVSASLAALNHTTVKSREACAGLPAAVLAKNAGKLLMERLRLSQCAGTSAQDERVGRSAGATDLGERPSRRFVNEGIREDPCAHALTKSTSVQNLLTSDKARCSSTHDEGKGRLGRLVVRGARAACAKGLSGGCRRYPRLRPAARN